MSEPEVLADAGTPDLDEQVIDKPRDVENTMDSSRQEDEQQDEWMDILGTGQLMKKVVIKGEKNTRPERSDLCIVNIVGSIEDGSVVESRKKLEIHLGDYEVVQGIDLALALMDVGEQAKLIVNSRFAYGSLGLTPYIHPGTTMYYDITLLSVVHDPPISEMPLPDRITIGNRKKERGNWWYEREENTFAIQCYRRALEYFDDTDVTAPHTDGELHSMLDEKLKTYNNLAAAQLKIRAYDAALISLEHVLLSQPKNVKALYRKSKILREKGDIQSSLMLIRQALNAEPDSKSLLREYSSLMAALKQDNSKQKDLYKKMLGNSDGDQTPDSNKTDKSNNTRWRWVFLGITVAIIGALATKFKY